MGLVEQHSFIDPSKCHEAFTKSLSYWWRVRKINFFALFFVIRFLAVSSSVLPQKAFELAGCQTRLGLNSYTEGTSQSQRWYGQSYVLCLEDDFGSLIDVLDNLALYFCPQKPCSSFSTISVLWFLSYSCYFDFLSPDYWPLHIGLCTGTWSGVFCTPRHGNFLLTSLLTLIILKNDSLQSNVSFDAYIYRTQSNPLTGLKIE